MKSYWSDWPERGLSQNICETIYGTVEPPLAIYRQIRGHDGAEYELFCTEDAFESQLYGFSVRIITLCVRGEDENRLKCLMSERTRIKEIENNLYRAINDIQWSNSYVYAKVVRDEPFEKILAHCDFEVVENRKIFLTCNVNLISENDKSNNYAISCISLEYMGREKRQEAQQAIRSICNEAFEEKGFSRHFSDSLLLKHMSGAQYMEAAIAKNFDSLVSANFVIARDNRSNEICGFTILVNRHQPDGLLFIQLLSVVRKKYRRRGVYPALTAYLSTIMPPDAMLLNITHLENNSMLQAYAANNRKHLADTIVMRRWFD